MSDPDSNHTGIIDIFGLLELAQMKSGNYKTAILSKIQDNEVRILAATWRDFQDLYPEEAVNLKSYVSTSVKIGKVAYKAKAASIAERLNSGFSWGPYDDSVDILVAAVACVDKFNVITSSSQMKRYASMGCSVLCLQSLLPND